MDRKNEIIQESVKRYPRFAERRVGFIDGALWADENSREGLIGLEEACKWLQENVFDDVLVQCGSVIKCISAAEFCEYFRESLIKK